MSTIVLVQQGPRRMTAYKTDNGTRLAIAGGSVILSTTDLLKLAEDLEYVADPAFTGMTCRICHCTDLRACEGGCSWAGPNLCTRCQEEPN